jgi:hypothetical protein
MNASLLRGALLAMGAILSGCSGLPALHPPPPEVAGRYQPLTTPIIALGDTQEHEATAMPMLDNDSAVDAYVEVAQRPPEQPLFGRKIFETVLTRHPDMPLLHLGDLLDVSCHSEAQRLQKVFELARQPGAILPGNHDGLLFGIFNYNVADIVRDPDSARWDRACRRGLWLSDERQAPPDQRTAFSKDDFIDSYLDGLVRSRGRSRLQGFVFNQETRDGHFSWKNPLPGAFVEAVEAHLTPENRYASSFVVQKLRLPAAPGAKRQVKLIGLDTNQLSVLVGTLDVLRGESPGDVGRVQADQIDAAMPWMEEARARGDIVVFAGHHNWRALGGPTRQRIESLMVRADHPLVYLSAHTHSGFWTMHRVAGRPMLELNVSSLSDWPIAYRQIHFEYDEAARRLKVVAALMPNRGTPPASDAELLAAWEAATCAGDGVPDARLKARDLQLVSAQRAARGSLTDWLYASMWKYCNGCQALMYEHGHRYLDLLLREIRQARIDLGADSDGLEPRRLPPSCPPGSGLVGCVETLLAAPVGEALRPSVALFREKAELVDRVNTRMDQLHNPRVRAYMSCRAVLAAKEDFELTPERFKPKRNLARRLAGDYFRSEASVGMDWETPQPQ